MATRAEIEARMADILNRSDFTARITIWFDRAYTALQRRFNFKAMELTTQLSTTPGMTEFPAPNGMKKSRHLWLYDTATGSRLKSYRETSLEDVRAGWGAYACEPVFTNWYGALLFAPAISPLEANHTLRYDCWRYLTPTDNDWFMTYAEDWLIYRGLAESAPFLAADPRLAVWQGFAKEIYEELWKAEVDFTSGEPLSLRG